MNDLASNYLTRSLIKVSHKIKQRYENDIAVIANDTCCYRKLERKLSQ